MVKNMSHPLVTNPSQPSYCGTRALYLNGMKDLIVHRMVRWICIVHHLPAVVLLS